MKDSNQYKQPAQPKNGAALQGQNHGKANSISSQFDQSEASD